jgi:Protein of unknown function (DUF3501)
VTAVGRNAPLTLDDIVESRAYEREREEFRARIIALKKVRRVAVGPVVTMVFENRETIRFQVQEMARAERLATDAAIQTELDMYNALIPGPGRLSATMFIELTSRAEMEEWLPRLVGIEGAVELILGPGEGAGVVGGEVDEDHAAQLTRPEVTPAVHYVRFSLSPQQIERFAEGPVRLAITHPRYEERVHLSDETKASLLQDLLG